VISRSAVRSRRPASRVPCGMANDVPRPRDTSSSQYTPRHAVPVRILCNVLLLGTAAFYPCSPSVPFPHDTAMDGSPWSHAPSPCDVRPSPPRLWGACATSRAIPREHECLDRHPHLERLSSLATPRGSRDERGSDREQACHDGGRRHGGDQHLLIRRRGCSVHQLGSLLVRRVARRVGRRVAMRMNREVAQG